MTATGFLLLIASYFGLQLALPAKHGWPMALALLTGLIGSLLIVVGLFLWLLRAAP